MKRITTYIVIITLVIFLMVTLAGCLVIPLYERFNIDGDTVVSIEIYDLSLCENISMGSTFLETESSVYALPNEQNVNFLNDLADIQFSDTLIITIAAVDPSFYYDDWTVRINYNDGSFQLISCDGYGETFDSDGKRIDGHHYGCDDEEWKSFIKKYVPSHIFNHTEPPSLPPNKNTT